jgi:hypothetical protein
MKFNKELQQGLDELLKSWEDPYDLAEYQKTYADLSRRNEICQVVLASHQLGLDLSSFQAFQLWDFISGEWGCSGWMSLDGGKDVPGILKNGIEILNYKKLLYGKL